MQSDWSGPLWAGESSEEAFGDLGQGTVALYLKGDGVRGELTGFGVMWIGGWKRKAKVSDVCQASGCGSGIQDDDAKAGHNGRARFVRGETG